MNTTTDQRTNRAILSNRSRSKVTKSVLFRPLFFLKQIGRWGFQLFAHCVDACYDLYRYLRCSNAVSYSTDDRQKLETLLFFYCHKIEKALSLPDVKPLFGLAYIETMLELADQWSQMIGDLDAVVFQSACGALAQYQKHVEPSLSQARPGIALRLSRFLVDYARPDQSPGLGGAISVSFQENKEIHQDIYFEHLVRQRHSVRNFIERHIPDSAITNAVALAQQTPSVCNRQCWRVHVFTSPADKARILKHQNGNEGFGHLADRVLLITSDLRSFLSSGERHQASVDSGMFSMTLILAFEAQGIASCCLNLCLSAFKEIAFRRESRIPEWEVPIMLILIGYPPESLQVAVSARKPTDSMLTFHDLDIEPRMIGMGQPR